MAKATAFFNTGWPRDPKDTLNTPFQILYYYENHKGEPQLNFTIPPGTILYVPILYSHYTPPVLWHFSDVSDRAAVWNYFYSPAELGNVSIAIGVDGILNPLGQDYVVGVGSVTLGDGPGGIKEPRTGNYIVAAVFLTPLDKGEHKVGFYSKCTGAAPKHYLRDYPDIAKTFISPNGTWEGSLTYTVTVK